MMSEIFDDSFKSIPEENRIKLEHDFRQSELLYSLNETIRNLTHAVINGDLSIDDIHSTFTRDDQSNLIGTKINISVSSNKKP